MNHSPKIGIISLGCPKALVDTETIMNCLIQAGYTITKNPHHADLIIINTCGFINEAIDESLEAIGYALSAQDKVIVTGCLGKRKAFVKKHYPQVIGITVPQAYDEIMRLVRKHLPLPRPTIIPHISEPPSSSCLKLTPAHYAYLKISEGCNHRCTYCIIPQLRGKLKSRPLPDIIREAGKLVDQGVKELILVAQDTTAYGNDLKIKSTFHHGRPLKTSIIPLLTELGRLGVWIRLHYLYPYPILDTIVELMAEGKVLPYLDVPLQHVNPRILNLMKRPAHRENPLKRIARWRTICPEITIRSSFIVGFPGETETEFSELLDFLDATQLDRVGCFRYSPVEGAKANQFPDPIPETIKQERENMLMSFQATISREKLALKKGKKLEVIVDDIKKTKIIGRTPGDAPEIDGQVIVKRALNDKPPQLGDIITVTIQKSDDHDLFGYRSTEKS